MERAYSPSEILRKKIPSIPFEGVAGCLRGARTYRCLDHLGRERKWEELLCDATS